MKIKVIKLLLLIVPITIFFSLIQYFYGESFRFVILGSWIIGLVTPFVFYFIDFFWSNN